MRRFDPVAVPLKTNYAAGWRTIGERLENEMNLSTTYLDLPLKNPIVASASPLSHTLDGIKRLEDAGAAAVVMYSLFEEQTSQQMQLVEKYRASYDIEDDREVLRYFANLNDYNIGPDEYVEQLHQAKAATQIPIIGSLNVTSQGAWLDSAHALEQAGADALELNVYYVPTRLRMTGAQVEQRFTEVLKAAKQRIHIPVAMKLTPFLSAPADVARQLSEFGANGLVLFNRFYQPDINLESMTVMPRVSLSTSDELRLPLRWTAILYKKVRANLAISTGVHTHTDVLKGVMAGAQVTMMASALLQNGVTHIQTVLQDLAAWMDRHGYDDLSALRGRMSEMNVVVPEAFERGNYIQAIRNDSQLGYF